MDRPSSSRQSASASPSGRNSSSSGGLPKARDRRRDILPEEEGPVFPDKARLPTIFIGSINGRYTRKVWKKDRDSVRTYYRQSRKFFHGTFDRSDGGIGAIANFVDKFVKIGYTAVRIVYSGKLNRLGSDDNRLMFDTGRDLSVRGLINFVMAKGMSLDLVVVGHNSFIWADVLGVKLRPGKSLTVYYPPYLLPTNLEDSSVEMFDKTGTTSFKNWEFFKATYKAEWAEGDGAKAEKVVEALRNSEWIINVSYT